MILNWIDPQRQILGEIKDEKYAKKDTVINIAACILLTPEGMDYETIKGAIKKRWGADGLKEILAGVEEELLASLLFLPLRQILLQGEKLK